MFKALLISDKGPHTSFGRVTASFKRALANLGWEVQTCILSSDTYFPEGRPESEYIIHSPSYQKGFFIYKSGIKKIIMQIKPDWILIIRPELGFLVPIIKHVNRDSVVTAMIHDTFAETLYPYSLKFWIINNLFIKSIVKSDGFVFNSEWTKKMALNHWKHLSGEMHVVGCVLDTQDFFPPEISKIDLRTKWNLKTSGRIYLNTSLDEPRKNIVTFFKLAKEYPDDLFIRVGQFSKWMRKFIKVHFISNVIHYYRLPLDKLRELYQLSDAFLYPSLLEGFGVPAFESMACGTPVISSGTSAMKENLEGFCSLIKNPKSIYEWKIVLDSKLPTEAATLQNSRKLLDRFSPESFEKKLKLHLHDLGF